MMEPTACELHAGCLGNINATWAFRGRSGHSARPWPADNAIERAAAGVAALAAQPPAPHVFDGLEFVEVASVTRDRRRDRRQRDPRPRRVPRQLPLRARPRRPAEAEARLAELCAGHGELRIDVQRAVRPGGHGPARRRAGRRRRAARAPKQAWTPVAEFGLAGLDAVNFGPGEPAQAHRRDESVEIAALVRAYRGAGGVRVSG